MGVCGGQGKLFFTGKKVFPFPAPPFSFKKSGTLWDISLSEPQRSDSSRRSETKTEGRVFPQPAARAGKEVFPLSPNPTSLFKKSEILLDDRSCPAVRKNFCPKKCNDDRVLLTCNSIIVKDDCLVLPLHKNFFITSPFCVLICI